MNRNTKPVDSLRDIPSDLSDEERMDFLEEHGVSEHFLNTTEEASEEERPRSRTKPINVRFDDHTLRRLKALANSRNVGYQTLLKTFVLERLYEEEKREGVLNPSESVVRPKDIEAVPSSYDVNSLRRALDNLEPNEQEALRLRFMEGLTFEEVAVRLGIPLGDAYRLVRRSLVELRKALNETAAGSGIRQSEAEEEAAIEEALALM